MRKTVFYVFYFFSPLYLRFRLSRVSQTIDLEEIYRLVSKILNFTPCGWLLSRFCVLCVPLAPHLSHSGTLWRHLGALWGYFGALGAQFGVTLGTYMKVTLEPLWSNFDKHYFLNGFMHLRGQLGVALGAIFIQMM